MNIINCGLLFMMFLSFPSCIKFAFSRVLKYIFSWRRMNLSNARMFPWKKNTFGLMCLSLWFWKNSNICILLCHRFIVYILISYSLQQCIYFFKMSSSYEANIYFSSFMYYYATKLQLSYWSYIYYLQFPHLQSVNKYFKRLL